MYEILINKNMKISAEQLICCSREKLSSVEQAILEHVQKVLDCFTKI